MLAPSDPLACILMKDASACRSMSHRKRADAHALHMLLLRLYDSRERSESEASIVQSCEPLDLQHAMGRVRA